MVDFLKLLNLNPILYEIALWIFYNCGLGRITSSFRVTSKGVHGQQPLRGLDFGVRLFSVGLAAEKEINERWEYDKERPEMQVAVYHETFDKNGKSNGLHLHIQVHPNTRRRRIA